MGGAWGSSINTAAPSLFAWQEDLVREEAKFADVGKAQLLVPMEELACSLVKFNVETDVDTCEELAKDVLAIGAEFFLPVRVGPQNRC